MVISSYSSVNPRMENHSGEIERRTEVGAAVDSITPDSLLDMPVVFADENDEESVINDVTLTAYQLK